MTYRRLQRDQPAFRIGDPAGSYPVFSSEGARRSDGRWHAAGDCVIYAAEGYSTAMLEKLVCANGILPPNQHFIEICIPAGISYEVVTSDVLPGWQGRDGNVAREFGHRWAREGRSAVLFVPSVVARMERNILMNTAHAEFCNISAGLETPIWWDERLFA